MIRNDSLSWKPGETATKAREERIVGEISEEDMCN